jgi:hypothetical protein
MTLGRMHLREAPAPGRRPDSSLRNSRRASKRPCALRAVAEDADPQFSFQNGGGAGSCTHPLKFPSKSSHIRYTATHSALSRSSRCVGVQPGDPRVCPWCVRGPGCAPTSDQGRCPWTPAPAMSRAAAPRRGSSPPPAAGPLGASGAGQGFNRPGVKGPATGSQPTAATWPGGSPG